LRRVGDRRSCLLKSLPVNPFHQYAEDPFSGS
jgi:hypothetical protein